MSYQYFTREEFACKCGCGTNRIKESHIAAMDTLRGRCGFPFVLTSAFRCASHPKEAEKERPGQHFEGHASDVRVQDGVQRRKIVEEAIRMGFNGIGVAKTFVHVDQRSGQEVMWTY